MYEALHEEGYICTQWCRGWGCMDFKRTTKSFDLPKIRAESLIVWEKPLKNWTKFLKIPAKMTPNLVWFEKMAPIVCRKTRKFMKTWRPFLEVTPKHYLCLRKFVRKSRTKTYWRIVAKFGQKSFAHPQNLPAPTPVYAPFRKGFTRDFAKLEKQKDLVANATFLFSTVSRDAFHHRQLVSRSDVSYNGSNRSTIADKTALVCVASHRKKTKSICQKCGVPLCIDNFRFFYKYR